MPIASPAACAALLLLAGHALAQNQPAAETPPAPKVAVPAGSPMITEILYAVPREGDADLDGKRSATGDEFIELVNPHKTPINLKGFTLTDARRTTPAPGASDKPAKKPGANPGKDEQDKKPADARGDDSDSRMKFTFPELVLKPGEVVVVFNGFESNPKGPVGTSKAAAGKNPNFNNAYVFTMANTSSYQALSNTTDCVLLISPDGTAIECVTWGDMAEKSPDAQALIQHEAPVTRGSVERDGPNGGFEPHAAVAPASATTAFSPGVWPLKPAQ